MLVGHKGQRISWGYCEARDHSNVIAAMDYENSYTQTQHPDHFEAKSVTDKFYTLAIREGDAGAHHSSGSRFDMKKTKV